MQNSQPQQPQPGYPNFGTQQQPPQPPAPAYSKDHLPTNAQIAYVNNGPYQCPFGGEHVYTKKATVPGILLGIFCFPVGVLCCFAMMEDKCTKCGYVTE